MKRVHPRPVLLPLAVLLFLGTPASSMDRPIAGDKLVIERTRAGREVLLFVSTDPRVAFPAVGGADDPAVGRPGGALVEVFARNGATGASFVVPRGSSRRSGWTANACLYRFTNWDAPSGSSPVRTFLLKKSRGLLVVARRTGLALTGPVGAVGIRVTTGTLRSCALFSGSAVVHDQAGFFMGRRAAASALRDCSDASLRGPAAPTSTTTTSSTTSTSTTVTVTTSTTTTTVPAGFTVGNDVEFPDPALQSAGFLLGSPLEVADDATLTHLAVIAKSDGVHVVLGLYADAGGGPGALVAATAPTPVAVGRMEIPVTPTPLAAGTYWIMGLYDGDAAVGADDSDPTAMVVYAPAVFGPLPDPFPAAAAYSGQEFNYYIRLQ